MRRVQWAQRWRRWSAADATFFVLVLLHTLPLLSTRWFPTLDGPCHLNNARILLELVRGNSAFGRYFAINPYPDPNWLGHALMALGMSVLPAWFAEKGVQLLALCGSAFAFRALLSVITPGRPWMALLVMPFLLCFTFFMGFINFSLGVALLLLALAEFERWIGQRYARSPWPMAVLLLLLYLSHLMVFAIGVILLLSRVFWSVAADENGARGSIRGIGRHLVIILSLPVVLAIGYFIRHHDHAAAPKRWDLIELLGWTMDGRAWMTFGDAERPWTRAIAIALLIAALIGVARSFLRREQHRREAAWFWLLSGCAAFVLYLVVPDSMVGGTFTSPRLLMFSMLLLCVWLATMEAATWLRIALIIIVCCGDLVHLSIQQRIMRSLEDETNELLSVASALPGGSVLLPLNYSDNWMHSNLSNYFGAERKAVVLDNFVATAPFAPVRWRPELLPYDPIGDFTRSNRPCVHIDRYADNGHPLVDHVLTWKMNDAITDSCTMDVRRQLAARFDLVASSPNGDARLYRRK